MSLLERLKLAPPLRGLPGLAAAGAALPAAAPDTRTGAAAILRSGGDEAAELRTLTVSPPVTTMDGDETVLFSAEGTDAIGDPVDLSFDVEWSSSAPQVLVIDANGRASARPVSGRAVVTAVHAPSGLRASAQVTVAMKPTLGPKAPPRPAPKLPTAVLKTLEIQPAGADIVVGHEQPFSATGVYADGYRQDETQALRWESSDPKVLGVDAHGRATARQAGAAWLVATEPNSGTSARVQVQVLAPRLVQMDISPARGFVHVAGILSLHVVGDFSDGTSRPIDDEVAWSSSDPDIVSVRAGSATGRRPGSATLTARYRAGDGAGGTVELSATVRVEVPTLVRLAIDPAAVAMVVGEERGLAATGTFSDGSRAEVLVPIWSSGDSKVLSIDGSGRARGRSAGSTVVTAASKEVPGIVATAHVNVTPAPLREIEIVSDDAAPYQGTLERGRRLRVHAVGHYALGSGKVDRKPLVSPAWSSTDTKVASVAQDGTVSALAPGKVKIEVRDPASGVAFGFPLTVIEPGAGDPGPDVSGLPAEVVDPYRVAKARYDELQKQVRELDRVPQLVKSLQQIKADLAKADKGVVGDAQMAQMQRQQAKGITLQIDDFLASAESAQQHIERCDAALEAFDGRQEVKRLREQGKEQTKNIKFVISLAKSSAKAARDPLGAALELVSGLVDRFETSAYDLLANDLEKKLDAQLRQAIGTELSQARTSLADAHQHLGRARDLAKEAGELLVHLREQAEKGFDAKAGKGSFRFSELTTPLAMADRIVDVLVPALRERASAAAVAIEKLRHRSRIAPDDPVGRRLRTMHDEALSWYGQAGTVARQADAQRQELRRLRDEVDKALAFAR